MSVDIVPYFLCGTALLLLLHLAVLLMNSYKRNCNASKMMLTLCIFFRSFMCSFRCNMISAWHQWRQVCSFWSMTGGVRSLPLLVLYQPLVFVGKFLPYCFCLCDSEHKFLSIRYDFSLLFLYVCLRF